MKTDCSDLNLQTPFVQDLDEKSLLKKLKQAEKSENYELLNACQEELYSRNIGKLKGPIGNFLSKVESNIIQGKLVSNSDMEMFHKLKGIYSVSRRHITRHMLNHCKTLGEKQIFQMVDTMQALREEEPSIEEINEAIDILRKYQLSKQNV
jgi:hypothetical protein